MAIFFLAVVFLQSIVVNGQDLTTAAPMTTGQAMKTVPPITTALPPTTASATTVPPTATGSNITQATATTQQPGDADICFKDDDCSSHHLCDDVSFLCRKMTCEEVRNATMKAINLANAKGKPLLGASPPDCHQDGTFSRVQCRGSVCFCVTDDGDNIQDYKSHVWERNDMDCQCARKKEEYRLSGMIGRSFACRKNGNYENVQCLGSVCQCVDEISGERQGLGIHISQKLTLNCDVH